MSSDFTLTVSSEMLFLDLPHLERVKKIHSLGYTGVIGLEGFANTNSEEAIQRFADAFN